MDRFDGDYNLGNPKTQGSEEKVFTPTDKQEQFIKATDKQVLLSGGFGAGKSRVGCEKGYWLNMQYAGNRGLIVRKHFSDVKASTVKQTLLEEVIPESHIVDHNWTDHAIKHKTGTTDPTGEEVLSEIHYHGLDSGRSTSSDDLPRKIGSMAYGWIFVDEGTELSKGEWIQLLGRLRYSGKEQGGMHYPIPFRQIFTATNPDSPTHWMYKLFYEDDEDDESELDQGSTFMVEMSAEDNPFLEDDYVQTMKEQYSGFYYKRYYLGKWVGSEGMIYKDFRRDTHIKSATNLPGNWEVIREQGWREKEGKGVWARPPDNWNIYRSIDFGYNNPFVCQWWARHPEKKINVLFREIYKTETLVQDLAEEIKKNDPETSAIEQTFADPAQAEDLATLQRYGIDATKAKKDVENGIQEVMRNMKVDENGRTKLYIMKNARIHPPDDNLTNNPACTEEEIPLYSWKNDDEDKPDKKDDHGCDAMRYFIYTAETNRTPTKNEMKKWAELVNDGF